MDTPSDGAFVDAWREHHDRLVTRANRMLGDAGSAEDVVQEAFRRLHGVPLDEIDDLGGWLAVVVRRLCLSRLRLAHVRRELPGVDIPVALADDPLDRVTLDDEVQAALGVVLQSLSPAERTAFVLHDVFGFRFEAIATIVGRTPAAVRQLASRARRSIRASGPDAAPVRSSSQHDLVVERFIAACEGGDIAALIRALDPAVDGHAELIGTGATLATQTGRAAVAQRLMGLFGPDSDTLLVPISVEDDDAVVAYARGELVALVRLQHDGQTIQRFHAYVVPPSQRSA